MVSGMHGAAWNAVVKDVLILAVVVFLGIYLPVHYYGGYGDMFRAIDAAKPGFLTFKPSGQSVLWFQSTVALTALGFYMWPHAFTATLTARAGAHVPPQRGAAAALSAHSAVRVLLRLRGDPQGSWPDRVATSTCRCSSCRSRLSIPWFVGVIGAAGVLTALVPGSLILALGGDADRQRRRSPAEARTLARAPWR